MVVKTQAVDQTHLVYTQTLTPAMLSWATDPNLLCLKCLSRRQGWP